LLIPVANIPSYVGRVWNGLGHSFQRPYAALVKTSSAGLTVDFRRVDYDIEAAAQGILASELPHEFAAQLREARGFRA
jgi:hypothetical protein